MTLVTSTFSGKEDTYCREKGISFLGVNFDFDDHMIDEFDSDYGDNDSAAGNGGAGGSNFRVENIDSNGSCDKIGTIAQNELKINNSSRINSFKDNQRDCASQETAATPIEPR